MSCSFSTFFANKNVEGKKKQIFLFDVHSSVHLGNVYVRLRIQLDVHGFICILYSSIFFAVHVSSAICTHPQEYKLQSTAIRVCTAYGMLIHWSRYWLWQPHTFSMVKCGLSIEHIFSCFFSSYLLPLPLRTPSSPNSWSWHSKLSYLHKLIPFSQSLGFHLIYSRSCSVILSC
jgi:hypothetical protein